MDTVNFRRSVGQHFGFLVSEFGFSCKADQGTGVRFERGSIFFECTYNDRDGVDVYFGREGVPGVISKEASERLSLGTFLGAIRTFKGTYVEEEAQSLFALAAGLREYGRGLILGRDELYQKAGELRFWHIGAWTQRWGTSIVMSPDEIKRERSLVPEIQRLIESDCA